MKMRIEINWTGMVYFIWSPEKKRPFFECWAHTHTFARTLAHSICELNAIRKRRTRLASSLLCWRLLPVLLCFKANKTAEYHFCSSSFFFFFLFSLFEIYCDARSHGANVFRISSFIFAVATALSSPFCLCIINSFFLWKTTKKLLMF